MQVNKIGINPVFKGTLKIEKENQNGKNLYIHPENVSFVEQTSDKKAIDFKAAIIHMNSGESIIVYSPAEKVEEMLNDAKNSNDTIDRHMKGNIITSQ